MNGRGTQALEALRRDVERLTRRLLEVAAERADVVRRMAKEKAAAGLPLRDRTREEDLLRAGSGNPPPPLTADSARRLVATAIEASIEAMDYPLPVESPVSRAGGAPVEVLGISEHAAPEWIVGPCTVESEEQLREVSSVARRLGCRFLRGGTFKARTSPHSFQGHGSIGLDVLRRVADDAGMYAVTEATGVANLPMVAAHADAIQIGSRNAQAFDLLDEVGRAAAEHGRAVVLKRGFGCTVSEWISAAEYIAAHTERIILCERGIRTFEASTRFTLDVAAVPLARAMTRLPVIVDASHSAGRRDLVAPLAAAGLAAGADGVMVEVHPRPEHALSDGEQQIPAEELGGLMELVELALRRAGSRRRGEQEI